jgi:hypothetical protein
VIGVDERQRPDRDTEELGQEDRDALARSVLEGPGGEAPREELAGKAPGEEAAGGGRLDDLDEVAEAARAAEEQRE